MTYLERMNQGPVIPEFPTSAAISGISNTGLEAIRNSQREHPEFYTQSFFHREHPEYPSSFSNALNTLKTNLETLGNPNAPVNVPVYTSGRSVASSRKAVDYLNADLAKHYGMSKSTAYQEALANTGYQRSVADMKAAGLNPAVLFGAGRASPASSSVYASSGGSGRSYGRRSSGDDKLFSGSAYAAIQAIGGLIGLGVSKRPDGFWVGSQTAKGAMGLLDSLWNK